jgi:Transposase DDE domain
MVRRRTKRPAHRRKRRTVRTTFGTTRASYRHGLKDAIAKWFPGQFFSRWSVTAGSKWSPVRIFWLAILMVWSAEQTLQARFEATRDLLRRLFPKWTLGKSYTGWYEAQLRWLTPLVPALSRRLREQMQTLAGRHWRREGWCAFAVDGSRVECPRTRANERELKCAGRKKTGPQLFVTTLWHMGTGLPWDFRIGPGTASERRHLENMLVDLPPASLVVADAGFTGYELYQRLLAAGQNFLLRVGANVHLLSKLGYIKREGRDIVYLWPERNWQQAPVVLRLIQRHDDNKKMFLVTNVLDKKALSEQSAAVFYEMRWGVEIFYRSLKQTLHKRKMLSHSPAAAKCELTWAMFGMWLLAWMSVSGILARGGDPLSWSAALARNRVRRSTRSVLTGRRQDRGLAHDLAWAVKDTYQRLGSKKARDWPHKKNEKPPGNPIIQVANAKQRRALKRFEAKRVAA